MGVCSNKSKKSKKKEEKENLPDDNENPPIPKNKNKDFEAKFITDLNKNKKQIRSETNLIKDTGLVEKRPKFRSQIELNNIDLSIKTKIKEEKINKKKK